MSLGLEFYVAFDELLPIYGLWRMSTSEVLMAKRRNPKKEKAQRNQAYARKFRKKKNTSFFSKRYSSKFGSGNNQNSNEQSEEVASAVEE